MWQAHVASNLSQTNKSCGGFTATPQLLFVPRIIVIMVVTARESPPCTAIPELINHRACIATTEANGRACKLTQAVVADFALLGAVFAAGQVATLAGDAHPPVLWRC